MLDINGYELIVLIVVAIVVLGPERLPAYAAKLGRAVRQFRAMAEGARSQLKEQLGPEFDDLNWRQYDPRQYDPRRIVREALLDPAPLEMAPAGTDPGAAGPGGAAVSGVAAGSTGFDPTRPVPWDHEAT